MADSVDHVTVWENIISDVKDLLIEEFKSSENIVKLVYLISYQKSLVDQAIVYLAKYRIISTATGAYLDEIGKELGIDRQDATDDEYRAILQIRAYRVTANGTRGDIISVLSKFSGQDETQVNTYVGKRKSFDVAFYSTCLNTTVATDELTKLFPVVSSYRLLSKGGSPLMFGSYYDSSDYSTDGTNGLGSEYDSSGEGGRLASLLYATD